MLILILMLGYNWPYFDAYTNPTAKRITSNFGDFRPAYDDVVPHLHEGIDIPEIDNSMGSTIYPIDCGVVVDTGAYIIEVVHYYYHIVGYSDIVLDGTKGEGSRYIHASLECDVGDTVLYDENDYIYRSVASGWGMQGGHLHLEYRKPGSMERPINPFFIPELCPSDYSYPILNYLYVDFENYGDADVWCWDEFLGHDFTQYYAETTYNDTTYAKSTLPIETPYNDLDDPHIIISGNKKVHFVLHAWDEVTYTGPDNAPYSIKVYLDGYPEFPWETENCICEVVFDSLNGGDCYEEEDVYSIDEPIVSGWGTEQYYRLYKKDINSNWIIPFCIKRGSGTSITENLEEGIHKIRIIVEDFSGNLKTADAWFYIQGTNPWLNFFRGE